MLTRWFSRAERRRTGTVAAIYVAPAAGQPMQPRQSIQAIAGRGLQGDRYPAQAGFWKANEACQVTLITEHELQRACHRNPALGPLLSQGHHRRNLVLAGLKPKQLRGQRFRIGTAVFAFHKPRPPCGYLDQVEGKGLCKSLGRDSGVCIQVIRSGRIAVGDPVKLLDPDAH